MATKYDTNPLDPDFPEKAKAAAAGNVGEIETQFLPYSSGETRRFPESVSLTALFAQLVHKRLD